MLPRRGCDDALRAARSQQRSIARALPMTDSRLHADEHRRARVLDCRCIERTLHKHMQPGYKIPYFKSSSRFQAASTFFLAPQVLPGTKVLTGTISPTSSLCSPSASAPSTSAIAVRGRPADGARWAAPNLRRLYRTLPLSCCYATRTGHADATTESSARL